MWSIYRIFKRQIFEPNLIRLPEMNNIRELIERSRRGIKFVGSVWGELEVFESLTFKSPLSTDMAFGAKEIGSLLAICVIWSRLRNRGWSKR